MHPAVTLKPTLRYSLHATIPSVKSLHNISPKMCGFQENEPASRVFDDNNGKAKVASVISSSDLHCGGHQFELQPQHILFRRWIVMI